MIHLWRVKRWALLKNHVIYIQNWCDVCSKYCDVYFIILWWMFHILWCMFSILWCIYSIGWCKCWYWYDCLRHVVLILIPVGSLPWPILRPLRAIWVDQRAVMGKHGIYEVLNLFISLQMIYIKHNGRNCMIIKLFFLCFLSCLENTNVSWG